MPRVSADGFGSSTEPSTDEEYWNNHLVYVSAHPEPPVPSSSVANNQCNAPEQPVAQPTAPPPSPSSPTVGAGGLPDSPASPSPIGWHYVRNPTPNRRRITSSPDSPGTPQPSYSANHSTRAVFRRVPSRRPQRRQHGLNRRRHLSRSSVIRLLQRLETIEDEARTVLHRLINIQNSIARFLHNEHDSPPTDNQQ